MLLLGDARAVVVWHTALQREISQRGIDHHVREKQNKKFTNNPFKLKIGYSIIIKSVLLQAILSGMYVYPFA